MSRLSDPSDAYSRLCRVRLAISQVRSSSTVDHLLLDPKLVNPRDLVIISAGFIFFFFRSPDSNSKIDRLVLFVADPLNLLGSFTCGSGRRGYLARSEARRF